MGASITLTQLSNIEGVCTNMSAPFGKSDTFPGNIEVKGSDSGVVGVQPTHLEPHGVVICGFKYMAV
jgi:hypothetical protein